VRDVIALADRFGIDLLPAYRDARPRYEAVPPGEQAAR
jgi:hypothetical protein